MKVSVGMMIDELNNIFDILNLHYYNASLEKPIITIQSNSRRKKVLGWCTTNKVWEEKDNGNKYYEIAIIAEFLYRSPEQNTATLLHEMVHLYCLQNNIKDTSRNGSYHNKTFKNIAEEHGLKISYDKSIGWSLTQLNQESISFVKNNLNFDKFTLTRRNKRFESSEPDETTENKKKTSRRYICPQCNIIIRSTKPVNIKCGDCNITLIETEN